MFRTVEVGVGIAAVKVRIGRRAEVVRGIIGPRLWRFGHVVVFSVLWLLSKSMLQ
jgi:hypothetical protein